MYTGKKLLILAGGFAFACGASAAASLAVAMSSTPAVPIGPFGETRIALVRAAD